MIQINKLFTKMRVIIKLKTTIIFINMLLIFKFKKSKQKLLKCL